MKKILTYTAITIAVLGICGLAAFSTQAETDNGNYPPIIQKLAERFNLNIDEVKGFFDEVRQERRQEMQTRFEERAGGGMSEPTPLTEEQKEALSAKREELREKLEALKGLSLEEKRAKMEEMQEEMKTWAEENGIDSRFIMGFGFKGPRGGFGLGFGRRSFCPEE